MIAAYLVGLGMLLLVGVVMTVGILREERSRRSRSTARLYVIR